MSEAHPEHAEIAEFAEGLLAADDAARLREHLAHCPACAEVLADLDALRQELREDPTPIPDDIAARIDAALVAEVGRARQAAVHRPVVSRETRWPRMVLAAAGALVALGLGGMVIQSLGSGGAPSGGEDNATTAQAESGARSDPLEAQVRELLAQADTADTFAAPDGSEEEHSLDPEQSTQGHETTTQGGGSASETTATAVPTCVREAIDRPEAPLAAKEETYHGVDSYLVVLPHTADPQRVDAYVVDARCVSAAPPAPGKIIIQQSYPRD